MRGEKTQKCSSSYSSQNTFYLPAKAKVNQQNTKTNSQPNKFIGLIKQKSDSVC